QERDHAQRTEPPCLVVGWGDGKRQRCTGLVPHAAVVAGDDAKGVVARRKVAVEGLAASAGVLPVAVPAFELVSKKNFLRRDEAERGVVNLQIANMRRQWHLPVLRRRSQIVGLVVGGDLLDMHWRRKIVEEQVAGIDDADATQRDEP